MHGIVLVSCSLELSVPPVPFAACHREKGLLRHTDLNNNPERFFLAHRLLARHAPALGPGFWIRFTVHYNLCAGTVLGLGNEDQIRLLDEWQVSSAYECSRTLQLADRRTD